MKTLLCPRTRTPLKKVTLDGVDIDISEGCGGVWFDNYELQKFTEMEDSAGDQLVEILKPFYTDAINHQEALSCPKCDNIILMRNFYSSKMEVEIDTCPNCGGVWLDPGDLNRMRSLFSSNKEREEYAREFVDAFAQEQLGEKYQALKDRRERTNKILNVVRFITPSSYLDRR